MTAPLHVVVLMGGWSGERAVSLMSGAGVAEALESLGHRVTRIDMDRNVAARLAEARPDVVFNALHGAPGEDGTVQGMLDLMGLRYTHSGFAASVIAVDKVLTKQTLIPHGIPMPGGRVVKSTELFDGDPLARPYVVKPVNEGSSLGVAIVTDDGNYGNPIGRDVAGPWQDFKELLAEPYVRGRELTTAVLGDRALGVTEISPKSGWYDFDAKYTDGMADHVFPAQIPIEIEHACKGFAVAAHRLLGCKGATRADFRWDDERGADGLFLLEINTQPGMTPLSLVPEQAAHCGISYPELVQWIIDEALEVSRAPAQRALKRRPQQGRGRRTPKKVGLMDRAVAALPVSEATLRRATGWSMFAAAVAVLLAMAAWLGIPGTVGTAVAESVGRAGFRVEQIEVTGARRMDRMTVYAVALDQRSRAMPLIDLTGVRDRLLDYPWIADARVSRRLPDTLAIDIVEREPVAIWQSHGQLMLIDVTGKPLEPVSPDAMPALPLVIGEGANEQEPAYQRLMEAAPGLKRQVKAASWVGDRRWDLLFASGEKLSLPEGEAVATKALAKFVELDTRDRLLGRGYLSFDLRDPSRMVLRMPGGGTNAKAITGKGRENPSSPILVIPAFAGMTI